MTPKTIGLSTELHDYLIAHGTGLDPVTQELIDVTMALGDISEMQIAPEQGAFMTMLTRLLGVTFAVEVGTFTGFSAMSIARGLSSDARLLCCDISEEWTSIACRFWERAGVSDKIDLKIAPAVETLATLPDEPIIDLAFIDADKPSYQQYYEAIVQRLSPNGVILVDNVLWDGLVVDPYADNSTDDNLRAIRAFNDHVVADSRTTQVMLPIADGLTFITHASPSPHSPLFSS
ncbi:MAG: O-methyltransferase [Acidimicrobiia bacterium]|nr:O-methyltransferase [Acidimicrobiia bacterium]MYC57769.1 O-methyltransferase [Acidimicrobiia bacterium]MYG93452.1 O-methyltransferase [Acidimicrobiia bacterium]MYI31318.1 O-methyltransferase [Acidimicrobiia bacterium]